ncbi:tetratricopeptide repeat protein [Halosquirtibacter laminarini]|uniref:Tetratricopeptide repeat protein n=1 Tax=Halosquirtibacter laminarini TaxID=3374600 RepID=A0AC61NLB8_9BACT|nr:tetratricopeptide repeat protein [Prolixibacteraceae bacterium]
MEQETNNNQHSESCGKEAQGLLTQLNQGEAVYHDVDQYEIFVDHFIQKNQLRSALRIVDYASDQHNGSISLWIKRAQIIFNLGQIDESIKLAKHCLRFEPNNAELFYLIGTGYLNMNKPNKAKKYFEQTFNASSENLDEVLFNIGYVYEQVMDYTNAIIFFRQAIKNNQENLHAIYDLAYCYDKIDNHKKAVWAYKHYLEKEPYNCSVWFNLGISLNSLGNPEEALEAYDYALAINDKHTAALFNKANLLSHNGEFEEAIETYNEYLKLEPDADDAYCYIADCYFNLRNYTEAIRSYKNAIKANKQNDCAWYGGALILLLNEDYEECLAFLKQSVKINPDISDYWISIGKVSTILNNYEEGEYALEKAISLSPKETEVWLEMAHFYHHYDQTSMAVDTLKRSKAFITNQTNILYAIAAYAFMDGQEEYGYQYLLRALEINAEECETLLFESFPDVEKISKVSKVVREYQSKILVNIS